VAKEETPEGDEKPQGKEVEVKKRNSSYEEELLSLIDDTISYAHQDEIDWRNEEINWMDISYKYFEQKYGPHIARKRQDQYLTFKIKAYKESIPVMDTLTQKRKTYRSVLDSDGRESSVTKALKLDLKKLEKRVNEIGSQYDEGLKKVLDEDYSALKELNKSFNDNLNKRVTNGRVELSM
jgi:hypothetical protein